VTVGTCSDSQEYVSLANMQDAQLPQPPRAPMAPPPPAPLPAQAQWAPAPVAPYVVAQPKSRAIAAALAIIFGGLGIHKFYMGKVAQGVLYLVFVWTYIPSIIAWIEGILYLIKSDEAWAIEHGWPVQRANGVAIALLWLLAVLPFLAIVSIVGLIFLGGQVSTILSTVGESV
jgi:TM2 domain-containing membrane protein YozV